MDNSDIKDVKALYSGSEYQAYLQIEFNQVGTEKLKEISNAYKATGTADEEENEIIEYISLMLDDTTLFTTYFAEEISNGVLAITVGNSLQDFESYKATIRTLENIVTILKLEKMPIKYLLSQTKLVQPSITKDCINIAFATILLIISCVLVVMYKSKGLMASIMSIGYIALLTLIIRYTNVSITMNSLISFLICIVINYIFIIKMLNKIKENESAGRAFIETMKEIYLKIIPLLIIAVVFTFMANTTINSIGMMFFWGIILQAAYSTIFAKMILD